MGDAVLNRLIRPFDSNLKFDDYIANGFSRKCEPKLNSVEITSLLNCIARAVCSSPLQQDKSRTTADAQGHSYSQNRAKVIRRSGLITTCRWLRSFGADFLSHCAARAILSPAHVPSYTCMIRCPDNTSSMIRASPCMPGEPYALKWCLNSSHARYQGHMLKRAQGTACRLCYKTE